LTREYVDNLFLVYKYPWLVALGILLVDTCRKPLGAVPETDGAPSDIVYA